MVGSFSIKVTTLLALLASNIVVVEKKRFWFFEWSWGSRDIRYLIRQVTRCLEGCVAPFVLTYHLAKFNGYRPYHSWGITSLICHMTLQDTWSGNLAILWKEAPHRISHPGKCSSHSIGYWIWYWICNDFALSQNLAGTRDHIVM